MRGDFGLQVGAALIGSFEQEVAKGRRRVETSLFAATSEYGAEVQARWRADIESSRLANAGALRKTIRLKAFRNKGLNPAVVVWSKFPVIQRAFEQSVMIKGKDGAYLAVPTEAAGKRAWAAGSPPDSRGRGGQRQRITPGGFERRTGMKLRFVYRRNGPSLLVVDNAKMSRRRGGTAVPYSKGRNAKLYGPEGRTIVIFILIKQVRTPRLLRGSEIRRRVAANGAARVDRLFIKHFESDTGAPLKLTGPTS